MYANAARIKSLQRLYVLKDMIEEELDNLLLANDDYMLPISLGERLDNIAEDLGVPVWECCKEDHLITPHCPSCGKPRGENNGED